MSSPISPIRSSRRLLVALRACSVAAAIACAAWALWPIPRHDASGPEVSFTPPPIERLTPDDDFPLDAFAARLWVEPPPAEPQLAVAPKPAPPPSPPPPLRLELLGIVRGLDDGDGMPEFQAVLYDPDADRVFFVSPGERIGAFTIAIVTESIVEVADGRATRRLQLEPDTPHRTGSAR